MITSPSAISSMLSSSKNTGNFSKTGRDFMEETVQDVKLKILSSQKRGGSRGVLVGSPPLRTQSPMFFKYLKGILSVMHLNVKKPVTAFRA